MKDMQICVLVTLTTGCYIGAFGSGLRYHRNVNRSHTCSRNPRRHLASPGWRSSTCSDLLSTTVRVWGMEERLSHHNKGETTVVGEETDWTHFAGCTFCPIEGGAFLGLAEVRVVRVTTPQLLTWVECAKLGEGRVKTFHRLAAIFNLECKQPGSLHS